MFKLVLIGFVAGTTHVREVVKPYKTYELCQEAKQREESRNSSEGIVFAFCKPIKLKGNVHD